MTPLYVNGVPNGKRKGESETPLASDQCLWTGIYTGTAFRHSKPLCSDRSLSSLNLDAEVIPVFFDVIRNAAHLNKAKRLRDEKHEIEHRPQWRGAQPHC